jgi:hypothetical protein
MSLRFNFEKRLEIELDKKMKIKYLEFMKIPLEGSKIDLTLEK